jgi:flavin-dependent dehydrogenase
VARLGASVLLVDKSTFPRSKVCGCCLNGSALAALDAVGLGDLPRRCGAVPLRAVRLAAGRASANIGLSGGVALSRNSFDLALIQEAEAAGVTVRTGVTARVAGESADGCDVRLVEPDQRVTARVVVLATGLAGSAGDAPQSVGSRLGAGVLVPAVDSPEFFAAGTIYMATGPGGYVGLVRVEDNRLDIAAAFDPAFVRSAGGLGRAAESILARTRWPAIPGLAGLPWRGTPALTRRPVSVAGRRQFAVGDAAGYVEPFTGEGMAWAISSATALAPIARRAALAWDNELAREWVRTHARLIGRRQGVCRVAARVLRSPLLTGVVVRALSWLPALSRPVVAALNRPPVLSHGPPA